MLVCVVAIAGREPLDGGAGQSTERRRAPERAAEAALPPSGPLPPEVFVFYPEEEPGMPAWLLWMLAGIVVTGIVTAGVLLVRDQPLWRGRRRGRRRARRTAPGAAAAEPSSSGTGDDAEVARRAVEAALQPLHDPTDPRAAVIAAYARMEQVLAERELGRRTPEAPREYLARVLREQRLPEESLRTVTALFEEARFSLHPIPSAAPRRALSALESVRVELGTADERNERAPRGSRGLRAGADP